MDVHLPQQAGKHAQGQRTPEPEPLPLFAHAILRIPAPDPRISPGQAKVNIHGRHRVAIIATRLW